ncbi:glycosyltransferase family 39 protein [candidate division TA06 bacterium]|nr:glycosyltransferase family 39 protein [candidate division TA06 bacterium]
MKRSFLLALALLLWGGFVINSYLKSTHFQKIPYLQEFLLLLVLLLLALGIGSKILRIFKFDIQHSELRTPHSAILALFSLALGFGFLSLLTLGLGLVGLLYSELVYLLLVFLTILTAPEILRFLKSIPHSALRTPHSAILILFLPILLFTLIGALAPPTFFDDLDYHLGLPQSFVLNHKITFQPYQVYSNFPLNMEMLYTFGFLLLQSDIFPKLLHFLMGILATMTLFQIADHFFNRRVALLSALIFYFTPVVGILSTFAAHDLTLTFFELLSVFALLLYLESRIHPPASSLPSVARLSVGRASSIQYLILSALMCGLAMGTKYTGLYFFATLFLFLTIKSVRHSTFDIRNLAVFTFFAFLVSSPWFIKNIINTGNPVYPAFSNLFGMEPYQKVGIGVLAIKGVSTPLDFLLLPYRMTVHPEGFGSASQLGPLYLIVLPIILFLRNSSKANQTIKNILFISGLLFLFWSFTLAYTRYYLTGIALLALVVAYLIKSLSERGRFLRVLSHTLLSFSLLFNFFYTVSLITSFYNPLPVVLGIQRKEDYLAEHLNYYPVVDYANRTLPEEAKILFLGETRTYYCERKTLSNSAYDKTILIEMIRSTYRTRKGETGTPHSELLTSNSPSLENLINHLKNEGVTHVLYNEEEAGFLAENFNYFDWKSPVEKKIYDEFTRSHLKTIFSQNGVYLLEIVY